MENQPLPTDQQRKSDVFPCPFGKPYNRVIICSAPQAETGVDPEWYTYDHTAFVVTRQFCAYRCAKKDVDKPVIPQS